jgi:hypothetical protein
LREETKNSKMEDMEIMKHDLIKKIEWLDQQFEISFSSYISETDLKSKEYTEKLDANQIASHEITDMMRGINRLKEVIAHWILKRAQNQKDWGDRNSKLQTEKLTILKHYSELKRKMTHFREDESRRLTNLTKNSKSCMDTLRGYQTLGGRILKSAELWRKLETEREKVMPFYDADTDNIVDLPEFKIDQINGLDRDVYGEFHQLDLFYKRYNKVMLDKVAIEKQKGSLEKENMFFKSLLKQYLDGVSVNNDVMNSSNPLLVVNNKVNLNRPPVQKMDGTNQIPLIEGNFEISNIRMQNNARYS